MTKDGRDDNRKLPTPMHASSVMAAVETPAFVVDERTILNALETVNRARRECGFTFLYALKPLASAFVLELMKPFVSGFAASSLFEAQLARSVLGDAGSVHITTPGFRPGEAAELDRLCDYIAFNSLSQFRRLGSAVENPAKIGLRINPQRPLVEDDRYNPCRRHSKLGVPLDQLRQALRREPSLPAGFRGLQFHTNCDSDDFAPLLRTVRHIEGRLAPLLSRLEWINLGGGYLFDPDADFSPLAEAVDGLRSRFGLEVFVEPGAALVREAGSLVAEVIDMFRSDGKVVAVLDTTVNHVPEVFEYQFAPDVLGDDEDGEYEYLLVGSTCLAGDVMGEYGFARPLKVGSRVVLTGVGAYTMVKAHMFNGINLPTIYSVTREGELVLRRRFTYDDFYSRCGASTDAVV